MSFNFPANPITGATFSFENVSWTYNGYAWRKYDTTANEVYSINGITGAIGLSAGPDISISLTGKTFTISSETLYGVSGAIYASNLATGLLHGGIISINAGSTAKFDITSGRGQIHASGSTFTRDPLPLLNYVTWPAQTGITVTNLATSDTTWLYIDGSGVLHQRTEYYTDNQLEENIIIGQLVHPSRTFINLARTNPNVAYATDKQYEQFIRAFGPIKISGHTITANGANLKLDRLSGKAFSLGRNWINNTDDPSVVSDAARTDCIFFRYYRGATAGTFITVPNQTVIDPAYYDNGSGILQSVPGGKYTIQRIFYYPNTPTLLGVYYGRNTYVSLSEAAANLNLEDFSEIENTKTNAIFVAYLIVKSNATSLLNPADALIIQAGSFRSTTSGGGSVSLTIDDLTDVIISSPQNYQVLTYVDGITGWENRSLSTLPLVTSFNGLCGDINGVSSVNGATGSISIIGGTGIDESISGKTLSLSLEVSGVTAGTTGGDATIPIITVDSYGRITNLTSTSFIDAYNVRTQSSSSNIDLPFGLILDSSTYGPILKDSAFTLNPATNSISFPGFTLTHSTSSVITSSTNASGGNKNLTVKPYGDIVLQPQSTTSLTSLPILTLSNSSSLASLTGADFYLGQKDLGVGGVAASIIFEGDTDDGYETTLSIIDPTADRTIYLPNASGTIALDNAVVTTFNGKTGAIQGVTGIYAGTGISVSGNTGNVTITNTGVLSIDGATGAITNVAKTDTAQTFTQLQSFSAGISASGGTFYGPIILQNSEYIQNSTNGRVDIMPAPTSSTAYGMYVDTTTWTYGVKLGTIKSSDGTLNAGGFLYDTNCNIGDGKDFTFGASSYYTISQRSSGGQQCVSIGLLTGDQNSSSSGSLVLVQNNQRTSSNRIPTTDHAHPTLYIYAGGSTADDYVRINHDTSNATIATGDGSIILDPANSVVVIDGDLTASGITSSTLIVTLGTTLANVSATSTTNTLDVVSSTDGVGLRIGQATTGAGSRQGGIRLGRSTTSGFNTYIENSSGTFKIFNGIDPTGTELMSLDTSSAAFTVASSAPSATITGTVNLGNITISGSQGSSNQVLASTGSGITWATASAGTKTYSVFTPLDNQPPASNYATVDTRNSIMVLEFDAATDESAIFVGVIPEAASLGSGLKVRIHWMADTATSGTCRWGVQIERMNTDEDSDSFDTEATGGSATNGTSGIITTTEITITTIDSVAAGEPYRLKVYRDADGTSGTDDMTGDAQLVAVEVRSAS